MPEEIDTVVREKNRILNRWEQYYGQEQLQSFPVHIQFPTGTRCNLKCRFCTERDTEKAKKHNYTDLTFDEFISIIDGEGWKQALICASRIDLYGWGEPLFNPDYPRIFDYVTEHFPGLGINVSTNGVLFNHRWAERILAAERSTVNFSVNAATKGTYCRLMGRDHFERVIANVHGVTELRTERQTQNPSVSLSFVATTENIRELPGFVDLSASLNADSVLVQDTMLLTEEAKRLSLENEPELARELFKAAALQARRRGIGIVFASFEVHPENYLPSPGEQIETLDAHCSTRSDGATGAVLPRDRDVPSPYAADTDCFEPWVSFMVRADGEVFPCCGALDLPGASLGNIYKRSFRDIWNGEDYRSLRRTINTDRPPAFCALCPTKAGPGN